MISETLTRVHVGHLRVEHADALALVGIDGRDWGLVI